MVPILDVLDEQEFKFAVVNVSRDALKGLGNKYAVDINQVLNNKVQIAFEKCLKIAIRAFLDFFYKNGVLKTNEEKKIETKEREIVFEYFKSTPVAEEIWHLLDPGAEIFDRGRLAKLGEEVFTSNLPDLGASDSSTYQLIFDAWGEFLKAFSFASRSTPEFREFLRASYEAGSFKALANIEDVLEKMSGSVDRLQNEGSTARQAIEQYRDELKAYRDWAASFQVS
ncbi:MAG: hypothetical protein KME17_15635 [Cyanosarcina radialis HA8281-LM2]|jgi:hypothetical protein|nr:hypothetical protein [Cyanosarcina radialis HA8281-LM2]